MQKIITQLGDQGPPPNNTVCSCKVYVGESNVILTQNWSENTQCNHPIYGQKVCIDNSTPDNKHALNRTGGGTNN